MPTSKVPPELSQPEQEVSQTDSLNYNEELLKKVESAAERHSRLFLKAEEAHERLMVCISCDKYLARAKICSQCKCFMPLKIRFRKSECPLEKW